MMLILAAYETGIGSDANAWPSSTEERIPRRMRDAETLTAAMYSPVSHIATEGASGEQIEDEYESRRNSGGDVREAGSRSYRNGQLRLSLPLFLNFCGGWWLNFSHSSPGLGWTGEGK